jgi:S1-C subfamily serine protease
MIGPAGDLLGIGSLQLERANDKGKNEHLNMIVPIDDLKPVLDDLLKFGKPNRPPRPWLGLYATEVEDKIVVVGLANRGPAQKADIRTGDIILAVAGREVSELATTFRKIWSLGHAGVDVPLLIYRDGRTMEVTITSSDRNLFLKGPSLH